MAEHDLTSPLLSPRSSDQPQTVLTVDEDSEPSDQSPSNHQPPLQTHNDEKTTLTSPNPYAFLGSDGHSVPAPTTVDPFRNGTPFISGVYEAVKIVLCLPIMLLRLVLFGACLAVGYIATRIALEGWKDKQNPMPKWRCRIMWVTRICARFILFSFGYHWIRRKGKPAPREIAPIVVSNHVSYIEPIFYFYELFPTIVASESHDSMPFVGTIIRAMQSTRTPNNQKYCPRVEVLSSVSAEIRGAQVPPLLFRCPILTPLPSLAGTYLHQPRGFYREPYTALHEGRRQNLNTGAILSVVGVWVIYVNRFSPASRKNAVNEIKRRASCDKFPRVLLFPEGTTTNGKVLISFQLGAFIPGHPIQPIIVRYPHVHFDQSWGLISLAKLMFRMFTQFHNYMEIEYLPIIMPPDNEKQSAVHFAERTGQAMASALNVVQTSHSYGDLMLLMKAAELQQERPWSYMVEMAGIESLYHISSLEAVDFLDKFLSMNPDTSGCVKLHDFSRGLRLKACKLSEEIFGFLDVEKNGSITFKQFLFGVAHVMKQPLFMQACELAFAECDVRGDNYCMKEELSNILRQAIPDLNEDEVHGLLNLFDSNNDGRISRDDFITCLRKNPLLIALFSPRLLQKDFSRGGDRMLEDIV
ncbi:lysophospholipid acyltransferase LPEAT2 isoform X1 [Gossypium australe]|uniref:Lysophospholipid acyltransferase LPEAT2 isoform X1 n=1 Tax=Gossypium australe TaxID=47621 RepID=A0A5B6UXA2_9ROSI|nr:lysophospholipid acyltransferase LPEAT2 isoform X1 [Gossypium australe]